MIQRLGDQVHGRLVGQPVLFVKARQVERDGVGAHCFLTGGIEIGLKLLIVGRARSLGACRGPVRDRARCAIRLALPRTP